MQQLNKACLKEVNYYIPIFNLADKYLGGKGYISK